MQHASISCRRYYAFITYLAPSWRLQCTAIVGPFPVRTTRTGNGDDGLDGGGMRTDAEGCAMDSNYLSAGPACPSRDDRHH